MAAMTQSWVRHPGQYIKEEVEERGWSQRDLAFILGVSEQAINPILNGKRGISPEMAKALGEAFDVPAEFFANLQQAYDLALARKPDASVSIRRDLQSIFPIREMIKRGWIEQTDTNMLQMQLSRFFEDENFAYAAKKARGEVSPAQTAWLYRVRQIAKSISVPKYSEKALRAAIANDFPSLLYAPDEVRQVPGILSECGIKLIFVEKLPNAKIDGVCFWLDDVPVIGMSLQHDRIDNFWFVLRHECEHVLNQHGKQQEMVDIDLDASAVSISEEERIANDAASNFCAPSQRVDDWLRRKQPYYYERDVVAFSRTLHRHPGIVIGQIRRKLNRYDYLSRYLVKVRHHILPVALADGWGQTVPVSL
ncbi:MAG TPA: HigA family addiction module antitoxin [Verrucomicrobiae bacterium]|nr:HigA family addiction module antitoxin [Verrucomicrobiae bacterium]